MLTALLLGHGWDMRRDGGDGGRWLRSLSFGAHAGSVVSLGWPLKPHAQLPYIYVSMSKKKHAGQAISARSWSLVPTYVQVSSRQSIEALQST